LRFDAPAGHAAGMIYRRHTPGLPLAAFVDFFWYYDCCFPDHTMEKCLPDGTFELVINLHDEPRKLFDSDDVGRHTAFRRGWLSGTHSRYIIIDAINNSSMIGAHFKPGGAAAFLNLPAGQLRDQVVELDALWGASAWNWRDRLLAAPGPAAKFQVLERFLLDHLKEPDRSSQRRKRVDWALGRFVQRAEVDDVAAVASALGMSHKHFIEEFRREVGLTPKLFCRIRRFQDVLRRINSGKVVEWADIAYPCGYFDQAHFNHDFRSFAGLNPSRYLSHRLEYPNFVRLTD